MTPPRQRARARIDRLLTAAGWAVHDVKTTDPHAARGVALREFELNPGHGTADDVLCVDDKACGVIEAEKQGATLTGVEAQSGRYAQGLPASLPAWRRRTAGKGCIDKQRRWREVAVARIATNLDVEARGHEMSSPDHRGGADERHRPFGLSRLGADDLTHARLRQGALRVLAAEFHRRRRAITDERTLPVLDAAQIRPYAEREPHLVANGLLPHSDLHTLFDRGHVTVADDVRAHVSRRVRKEFASGHEYGRHGGQPMVVTPESSHDRPARDVPRRHGDSRFVGWFR